MFGSFNIGTDYTFTQSDNQDKAVSKPKVDSSNFGDSNVTEKPDFQPEVKKDTSALPAVQNKTHDDNSDNNEGDYKLLSDKTSTSVTNSFDALAAAVGGVGGRVTKDQLLSYLHSLTSDPTASAENIQEVTFLKALIAQFDTISGDTGYITSLQGIDEPQDYTTVTPEQVTPPIDIRV